MVYNLIFCFKKIILAMKNLKNIIREKPNKLIVFKLSS